VTARPWPVHRAQAKVARIAADFLKDDAHPGETIALLHAAASGGAEYDGTTYSLITDAAFRELLGDVLSWGHDEIEPAVAWVYGDAPEQDGEPQATIARLTHERNELGRAIADTAQRGGIYNGEVPLTGPDLLLLAKDMGEALAAVHVAKPVAMATPPAQTCPSCDAGQHEHCGVWGCQCRCPTDKGDCGSEPICERPINVFLSPGGVEPAKWRSR
jgi:hypothetical protein